MPCAVCGRAVTRSKSAGVHTELGRRLVRQRRIEGAAVGHVTSFPRAGRCVPQLGDVFVCTRVELQVPQRVASVGVLAHKHAIQHQRVKMDVWQ